MALIRSEKNVWCHMVSEEYTVNGIRDWSAGKIQLPIYDSLNAAVTDLKGFVKALRRVDAAWGGHKDIYDFTRDGEFAAVEWTDAWTGKRMRRWVTDLPFFHG